MAASPPPLTRRLEQFLTPSEPLDMQLLSDLPDLPVRARYLVEGFMSSIHRSALKGSGVEFTEYRAYQPGDDLRRIDWRLYGRSDRLHIKLFEEEIQLRVVLVLDTSSSMSYSSVPGRMSKLDFARTVLGAMALLAQRQQDAVGVALLAEELGDYVKPRASTSHIHSVLTMLDRPPQGGITRLADGLSLLAEALPRRCLVVIASDFYEDIEPLGQVVRRLRHERHDVIAMHVLDPFEVDLNMKGNGILVDLESGAELPVEPQAVRRRYQERFRAFQDDLSHTFCDTGFDLLTLRTDESPMHALATYLTRRAARI